MRVSKTISGFVYHRGTFKNRLKIIANLAKIDIFAQLAMDFYEWPEYETFFLQLEFRWWTCKNSIAIDICNRFCRWAARYDNTNTHSIKILLCGLAHGEVLPPDEANVSEDFTVSLRYFTQSCWAQSQSNETLKGRPLLNLCIMHPITILIFFISTEYPGNRPGWKF